MTSFLNRLLGRGKRGSSATAKDRLRFVLQHDRINLPPERMEEMKRDILAVIVKYVVVDKDRVEIALEQRDRNQSKLVAEIPVVKETPVAPSAANEDITDDMDDAAGAAAIDEPRADSTPKPAPAKADSEASETVRAKDKAKAKEVDGALS